MIVFVVNEASGNGRARRTWAAIEPLLAERRVAYVKITAGTAEDARRQAEDAAEAHFAKALVAVGGDGTVHSLLPLALKLKLPLGLIPSGSGNDTALAFGIPRDPAAALEIVLRGTATPADVMAVARHDGQLQYTLISVAIGLDGAVAADVNCSAYKRWCNRIGAGSLAYIIGLFRMLAVYKPGTIAVTVDGARHEFHRSWLAAAANLATYGGGLRISPDSRPDDGLLRVCVVHGCHPLQLLLVFPTVLRGTHVRSRFVTMLSGRQVTVESAASAPLLAFGDGEPAGQTPVRADVLPLQLLFLTSSASG